VGYRGGDLVGHIELTDRAAIELTYRAPIELPTYLDIIKRPMDLGTVKTKLNNASYTKPDDFAAGTLTRRPVTLPR